jgi:arginyl-tRNA synthetase
LLDDGLRHLQARALAMSALADLEAAVRAAAAALGDEAPKSAPTLERSRKAEFGDYATNAAMLLAPVLKQPPRDVAGRLGEQLAQSLGGALERSEVAGPGFLNLFLSDEWHRAALAGVLGAGERYGSGTAAEPERINLEFVSANPTGPMTAASARHAAFGDALARVLEFAGHEVGREYYFNDQGSQITRLAESIRARARGEAVPEDGYQGEYVAELAREIPGAAEMDVDELAAEAVERLMAGITETLEAYGVHFDTFFSERSLHEGDESPVARTIADLRHRGHVYEADGAIWLRTSDLGDEKDRVLVRSNGDETYFSSDTAYALDKRERGWSRLIYVLGADHHGYVGRMQALWQAIGGAPGALEILILQFVHLVERDERASMSKRAGDFVTLEDLIAEIGVDAARWFMLSRSADVTVDLDLDLAREQSAENPVYYVQYAHARIASVLRKAGEARVGEALGAAGDPAGELHPSERALIKKLLAFPAEAAEAAERRAPHRIANYALELAQDFTAFYRDCQVVGAEPAELESQRIALSVAARRTISTALGLLGVSAPESM